MDFYRLAINDLTDAGMQPFVGEKSMLMCNGEIYNHKIFRYGFEKSSSDCEILLPMVNDLGMLKAMDLINGDFAIVWSNGKRIMAARDPVGVRPLFYTRYDKDSIAFASEAKALRFLQSKVHIFPPGHIYDSYLNDFVCYHTGYWHVNKYTDTYDGDLKETFIQCVHERLATTDRDIGFLLSGGLDSSLIASIAARKLDKINTFSIGLVGSPDLEGCEEGCQVSQDESYRSYIHYG
jgi:asparagine synthase (glutamine-hydrolysing)